MGIAHQERGYWSSLLLLALLHDLDIRLRRQVGSRLAGAGVEGAEGNAVAFAIASEADGALGGGGGSGVDHRRSVDLDVVAVFHVDSVRDAVRKQAAGDVDSLAA